MSNGTGNFRKFQISREKGQLREVDRNFRNDVSKIFFAPFDFEPEFSELLVEWNSPSVIFICNRIYNIILDRDWLSGRLFVT